MVDRVSKARAQRLLREVGRASESENGIVILNGKDPHLMDSSLSATAAFCNVSAQDQTELGTPLPICKNEPTTTL